MHKSPVIPEDHSLKSNSGCETVSNAFLKSR